MEITDRMAESLMVEMNCPASGGTMSRKACGRMTWRSCCRRVSPVEADASHWPRPTPSSPARTISVMYAPSYSPRTTTPERNTGNCSGGASTTAEAPASHARATGGSRKAAPSATGANSPASSGANCELTKKWKMNTSTSGGRLRTPST